MNKNKRSVSEKKLLSIDGVIEKRRCWRCHDFHYIEKIMDNGSVVFQCKGCGEEIFKGKNIDSEIYPEGYQDLIELVEKELQKDGRKRT